VTLLRALGTLRDLQWSLELAGGGSLEGSIRRLGTELGIADRICYLGSIRNVAEQLCESSIFVLSSHSEAFPLSIIEAMRAGLPVVATDVGGVSEAVLHDKTGFLVPRNDHELLSSYLRRLISDPALRHRLGSAGRLRYESYFTFEQMLAKYIRVYDEIVGQPSSLALAPSGGA
jgi:glycosyltransferase involved in cell wall biosynthesis